MEAVIKAALAIGKWYKGLSAIGQFVVMTAATTAASYVVGRILAEKPSGLTQGNPLDLRVDPLAPARIIYGYRRVGGDLRFRHAAGTDREYLYLIISWASHPCFGLYNLRIDDEIVPLDVSGNATGKYAGFLRCTHHLGASDQTADANFVAEIGTKWTSAHRRRGNTYSAIRLKYDSSKFPGGLPLLTVECKGKNDLYDPVAETTGWSDNTAIIIRDYLLDDYVGLQGVTDDLDETGWLAEVNICAEDVTLADGTSTEPRYTCNLAFDTSSEPKAILETMLATCAGKLFDIGGIAKLRCASWITPDFDIDETMLRGGLISSSPLSMREKYNRVATTFTDPAELWNSNEAPAVASSTYLTADGDRELSGELDLTGVTSAAQAQRIAKITLLRSRQGIVVAIPGNLRMLPALPGETIRLTNTKRGWTNKHFEVEQTTIGIETGDDGGLGIVNDAVVHEGTSTVYDWGYDEESAQDPAPNTDLGSVRDVPDPAGLALTSGAATVVLQPDGTNLARLKAAWTLPADIFVTNGGLTRVEYRLSGGPTYSELGVVDGITTHAYILGLVPGSAWQVRIRHENRWTVGAWSSPVAHTLVGDVTAPGATTGVTAEAFAGYNRVTWSPNAARDTDEYLVYRHTSNSFGDATQIYNGRDLLFDDSNATPGTEYYYWILAEDTADNTATAEGTPDNVTTAAAPAIDIVPTASSAATKTADGTRLAGDGRVSSFLTFSLPALPANAIRQDLVYRNAADAEYIIAGQYTNGSTLTGVVIDDLVPGQDYAVALIAWSAGQAAAATAATSSPFTAPNKTDLPSAPTSISASAIGPAPKLGIANTIQFNGRVSWVASASKDVAFYEAKCTYINSDASVNYSYGPGLGVALIATAELYADFYSNAAGPAIGWIRVRAIDKSGNASAWAAGGSIADFVQLGAGSVAAQDSDSVELTGLQQGGSGAVKILAEHKFNPVQSLTGGAATEVYDYSISGRGFGAKPDGGDLVCLTSANIEGYYDYDDATSTSTVARFNLRTKDGTNLPSGNQRFAVHLYEYD